MRIAFINVHSAGAGSCAVPTIDHLSKRLRKKSKKGMRGWPIATIAFYGPDASRATKVVVSIIPNQHAESSEMCDWQLIHGDVRNKPEIAAEMLAFMELHRAISPLRLVPFLFIDQRAD